MKTLKIFLMIALPFSLNLLAQSQEQSFSRFRALLRNGNRIEGKNAILTSGELKWTSKTGDQRNVSISEIRAMDRYAGTHAIRGAAIGGGVGLLTGLTLILYANADETRELKVNEGALLGGLTVVYGLVGLAIGSAFSTWERVPLDMSLRYYPSQKFGSFSIEFSISILIPKT